MRIKVSIAIFVLLVIFAAFSVFFDEAVLVRQGTVYHINTKLKVVALTFDDGPSPIWTPKILKELKKANVKATFFMIGKHVAKYPEIAKLVALGGNEIGNHTYNHHVLLFYKEEELDKEIRDTEKVIKKTTGRTTSFFRPPKAWLTSDEKKEAKRLGYKVILWTLNSKDWVTFDDKYMVRYIVKRIRPGDIILFHDSGGVFSTEGGDRHETVKTIPLLVEKLRKKGYRFATISKLLDLERRNKDG